MKPWHHSNHPPDDMKRVLSISLLCLVSLTAAGADRFDEASRLFAAGDTAGAATVYQEVLRSDGPDASVFFNLGNCEQKLGKYGPAILAYERARLLDPRDPDISANLALARKAAAVFEETGGYPRLDAILRYLSLNEWSWLVAGAALFLGILAVVCGSVRLPKGWLPPAVRASVAVAVLLVCAGAAALYLRRDEGKCGVVLTDGATVRLSPFETAESLGSPGPGRIVHMLKAEGGYHFVEVPGTGLRGWMSGKDVSAIAVDED
jgi:hypothetical protein